MRPRAIPAVLLALVALSGCGSGDASADRPLVVATTTILGDVVSAVTGDAARVEVLMPAGADPHTFQASAREAARLRDATLVVANGLAFEEGLSDVLDSARDDGVRILEVAPLLDPLPLAGEDRGSLDPHVWMDPVRMADAVTIIGDRLEEELPGNGWGERAAAYRELALGLHEEIAARMAEIPSDRRMLVTNHEALGYFADRYGFQVVGVIIPGGSTQAAPGPRELTELARLINELGVKAIFAETTAPTALADNLAEAAGGAVAVVELYTESLGEAGSGAETYLELIDLDATRIAGALL